VIANVVGEVLKLLNRQTAARRSAERSRYHSGVAKRMQKSVNDFEAALINIDNTHRV